MVETTQSFSNWLTQIPLPRAARKVLILCASCAFTFWFLFLLSSSPASSPLAHAPAGKTDLRPNRQPPRAFNDSKVALLIEDRPMALLAPLLLHMISVVPPDWRFIFLGSAESVAFLNNSLPVQMQARNGKLDLRELPGSFSSKGQEPLSQTLTTLAFWQWLGGKDTWDWEDPYVDGLREGPGGSRERRPQVEWVLVFQTDSILCANSKASLNDWLHYDWVGAPWHIKDQYGGNGGLSLRRVSRIIQVLHFQTRRAGYWEMEDLWLIQRIGVLPGARMANGTTESRFSVEQVWSDEPMGYHLGWSGARLAKGVWNDPQKREKIWNWCPEIKLILDMRLERECQAGHYCGADESMRDYDEWNGRRLRWGEYRSRKRNRDGDRDRDGGRAEWPGLSPW